MGVHNGALMGGLRGSESPIVWAYGCLLMRQSTLLLMSREVIPGLQFLCRCGYLLAYEALLLKACACV